MKKSVLVVFMLLVVLLCGGCAAEGSEGKTIVTSFYPMYVFTQNIAQGVPDVRVVNMTAENGGCLHDYQLQTRDMAMLEGAMALVVNGGGMEQFMDKIAAQQPNLTVVEACSGIEMLPSEETHEAGHDHGAMNPHVWLDPSLAVLQVRSIAQGLAEADSANAEAYLKNGEAYAARIEALDQELRTQLAPLAGSEIVTFHEAFSYMAKAYDLHIAGVIAGDSGEEPSTRQIAKTCDLVKAHGIKALFVEPQYPTKTAETIARETGAQVYSLDPVVSGDGSMESYERAMRENARVLTEALLR
ncbi:MAG: metal ABC transporter substrate-binding protein [Christensenellales bacterium]|nr:metal ABC transporter substrate-binding protein [Christensenellales bacterium]